MAEQEVIKHTKKVYKIWHSNELRIGHKLKEFLIEIFTIVFAVSLSIWLHDRSEHSHQQKEVKEFLLGLKDDLKGDITEMEEDKKAYLKSRDAFRYVTSIKMNELLNADSIEKNSTWMFNTTGLVPNNGRFEGFKSSGKIGTIENRTLQNDIMDLYQENIPALIATTNNYSATKQMLFAYYYKNIKRVTDSTSNLNVVLSSDEAQRLCTNLSSVDQILERYDQCINKIKKINIEIDKEYNE